MVGLSLLTHAGRWSRRRPVLQRGHAGQLPALQELQRRAAAGRDVASCGRRAPAPARPRPSSRRRSRSSRPSARRCGWPPSPSRPRTRATRRRPLYRSTPPSWPAPARPRTTRPSPGLCPLCPTRTISTRPRRRGGPPSPRSRRLRRRRRAAECRTGREALFAVGTHSSSTRDVPTSSPRASMNVAAMPPPTNSVSTCGAIRWRTASLSDTFAPPNTAANGRAGDSNAAPSICSSRAISSPATAGRCAVTPTVEACARCAAPKASLTNRSASEASIREKSASFFSSPGWNLKFSSSSTPPGRSSPTARPTSGPTQSGAYSTRGPSSSARRLATGFKLSWSTSSPPGRPRWEHRTTLHRRSSR